MRKGQGLMRVRSSVVCPLSLFQLCVLYSLVPPFLPTVSVSLSSSVCLLLFIHTAGLTESFWLYSLLSFSRQGFFHSHEKNLFSLLFLLSLPALFLVCFLGHGHCISGFCFEYFCSCISIYLQWESGTVHFPSSFVLLTGPASTSQAVFFSFPIYPLMTGAQVILYCLLVSPLQGHCLPIPYHLLLMMILVSRGCPVFLSLWTELLVHIHSVYLISQDCPKFMQE